MKYFLGLTFSGMHDSNVAVVDEDGVVAFAVNEERLSGWKKDGRWPSHGLALAKNFFTEKGETCAGICVPFVDPTVQIRERGKGIYTGTNTPYLRTHTRGPGYGRYPESWTKRLRSVFPLAPLYFAGHHRSHAALAFFQSGFKQAHVITADGGCYNEPWHLTIWHGNGSRLRPLSFLSHNRYFSIARFYANVTALLGFRGNEDEGKITGLSAYGVATKLCVSALKRLLHDPALGVLNYWINTLDDHALPRYLTNTFVAQKLNERYLHPFAKEDVAASLQLLTEQSLKEVLLDVIPPSSQLPLALAGGLFANVKLNASLRGKSNREIFVAPAMGDEGLSIGAVLGKRSEDKRISSEFVQTLYRGPSLRKETCVNLLRREHISYKSIVSESDLVGLVSRLLSKGKIVALCRGPMEYGPRALGNRSILASAMGSDISKDLNRRLQRSEFMPFAPVVRKEDGVRCFRRLRGAEKSTAYMTMALPCTDWFRSTCPAVVHVDGTARPQLVDPAANFFLHQILTRYQATTDAPALINTSFNLHGEPIVCTPEDAIRSFFVAGLDYLVLDHFVVSLSQNRHAAKKYLDLQRVRSRQRQHEKEAGLISGLDKKIYEFATYPFFD